MLRWLSSASAIPLAMIASCSSPMQRTAPLSPEYLAANPLTKESKTGIPYYLPDTVVPITISGDFVVVPGRKGENPSDYEYVVSVTIGKTQQVPDPNAALMLEYVPEIASDDVFKLEVGSNGLLSNVKSTSTDQSGAVILKLVELAKEVIKLAPALTMMTSKGQTDDATRTECYNALQKMSVADELNLSDVLRFEAASSSSGTYQNPTVAPDEVLSKQVASLNSRALLAMQKRSVHAEPAGSLVSSIRLDGKPLSPVPGSVAATPPAVTAERKAYSGVVFRTMAPRRLSIAVDAEGLSFRHCIIRNIAAYQNSATVMIADPAHTFVADTSRAILVSKKVDLIVSDGVLTGIEVDKKSELLQIVSLPVEILKAIASIPGEVLSVKVKQLTDENKLTTAQADLLKAQIELIKQKQALLDAQKKPE
jgi:hypothetical protein